MLKNCQEEEIKGKTGDSLDKNRNAQMAKVTTIRTVGKRIGLNNNHNNYS